MNPIAVIVLFSTQIMYFSAMIQKYERQNLTINLSTQSTKKR